MASRWKTKQNKKCSDIKTETYWDMSIRVQFAPCKRIHEGPGFRIPASRFRIPAFGFRIPTFWIPYQSGGFRIPNHCGFRIPTAKICWISDSLTWGDTVPPLPTHTPLLRHWLCPKYRSHDSKRNPPHLQNDEYYSDCRSVQQTADALYDNDGVSLHMRYKQDCSASVRSSWNVKLCTMIYLTSYG